MIYWQYDDEVARQLGLSTFLWAYLMGKDYFLVETDRMCFRITGQENYEAGGLRFAVAERLKVQR